MQHDEQEETGEILTSQINHGKSPTAQVAIWQRPLGGREHQIIIPYRTQLAVHRHYDSNFIAVLDSIRYGKGD